MSNLKSPYTYNPTEKGTANAVCFTPRDRHFRPAHRWLEVVRGGYTSPRDRRFVLGPQDAPARSAHGLRVRTDADERYARSRALQLQPALHGVRMETAVASRPARHRQATPGLRPLLGSSDRCLRRGLWCLGRVPRRRLGLHRLGVLRRNGPPRRTRGHHSGEDQTPARENRHPVNAHPRTP